jgi:N-acetylneuraminic acid mutarotase
MGYGVAISSASGILLIGGQTPDACLATTYRLSARDGQIVISESSPLPEARCHLAGASVNGRIIVAGGQSTPSAVKAERDVWSLDPNAAERGWRREASWPGPAVIMPMAAAVGGAFYLIGGAELTGTPGPPPGRKFLANAYRFQNGNWSRLPDLPGARQAGYAIEAQGRLIAMGGNDGELAHREFELRDKHPGFPRTIFRLDEGRRWGSVGEMPASLVTSGIVKWNGLAVIAGGEDRPGHRSARVIARSLKSFE